MNGALFFTASEPATGRELWTSDGTRDGTFLVRDINPGTEGSDPGSLTHVNGSLFFVATVPETGRELWQSDGTKAGTVLVDDIFPGESSSNPAFLTAVGGGLFFAANDGFHGTELWSVAPMDHAGRGSAGPPRGTLDPASLTLLQPESAGVGLPNLLSIGRSPPVVASLAARSCDALLQQSGKSFGALATDRKGRDKASATDASLDIWFRLLSASDNWVVSPDL